MEKVVVEVSRNRKDTAQLYNAAITGSVATFKELLTTDPLILNEASLTSFCETPLHIASSLGHLALTRAILQTKPQLAAERDALGRTPLHLASAEGHVDIVRALLEGSDQNVWGVRDDEERSALHLAVMRGRVGVIRELIGVGTELGGMSLNGDSVMHLCVKYGHLEALQALVQILGQDCHHLLCSKDTEDNTILHLAVLLKQLKIVRYLGSLPKVKELANAVNASGCTALDVLHKCPQDSKTFQIQSLLLEMGVHRAKDVMVVPTNRAREATRGSNVETWLWGKRLLRHLSKHVDWVGDTHGSLMVVATVIATMSFQAAIAPPGGVWQQDIPCPNDPTKQCKAGTAVFTYDDMYMKFATRNTASFLASVCVIVVQFGGLPLKTKFGTWLITVAMCVTLTFLVASFTAAYRLTSPGYDNYVEFTLLVIIWFLVLLSVSFIHTMRFVHWLLYKKIRSCLSPHNCLFRKRLFPALVWFVMSMLVCLVIYRLVVICVGVILV